MGNQLSYSGCTIDCSTTVACWNNKFRQSCTKCDPPQAINNKDE